MHYCFYRVADLSGNFVYCFGGARDAELTSNCINLSFYHVLKSFTLVDLGRLLVAVTTGIVVLVNFNL